MLGKKSSEKCAKNVFFIFTQNRDQKMGGGKNARNNFSRNTRIVREKIIRKKIVGKKCEKLFFNSHEYRDQKMGGKTRETIFPETNE